MIRCKLLERCDGGEAFIDPESLSWMGDIDQPIPPVLRMPGRGISNPGRLRGEIGSDVIIRYHHQFGIPMVYSISTSSASA